MIKFTVSSDTGKIGVGLGLEHGNLERLKQGQPIRVAMSDLGFVGVMGNLEFLIFSAPSDEELKKTIAQFIGPQTVVIDETKDPVL